MRAALYARSSKDRHDVSIDVQRRELATLAKTRSQRIVSEFTDAVESGKDDDREGFQSLLRAIRNPRRGWDTLLVLDTSRVARRRNVALFFEEECRKHGVRVIYKNMPESDPVTDTLLKAIMQALDEWHSLTSRQKGLAGMRENVRQGFRAGGRAPAGYVLEAVETGAVREGVPVRKSRLVPGPDAPILQAYLRARAAGVPRARAGLPRFAAASLVGIEWNALTYAGHTVWNVHAEAGSGRKRRPRAEWVVQRDTHQPLISEAEAEAILARLEAYGHKNGRARDAGYLLAGLLFTPDGRPYHGDRGAYRVKGKQVQANRVDRLVADHIVRDIQSPGFVRAATAAAKAGRRPADVKPLREALSTCDQRLARLVALIEQTDTPGPLLRQMEALEAERLELSEQLATIEAEDAERAAVASISEHEVRRLMVERAEQIEEGTPESLRETFQSLLARVELDESELVVHYRFARKASASAAGSRFRMASPRESELIPVERRYKLGGNG